MERGLYAAATGMMAQQNIQDILAQNMANSSTIGYKQDVPTFKSVHGMALRRAANGSGGGTPIGEVGIGVAPDKISVDWQIGPQVTTNSALDASLAPGQYFAIQTDRGTRYTRAGNFQVDNTGSLLTGTGLKVLDNQNRPITIAGSVPPRIEPDGAISVSGAVVARVQIVQAPNDTLVKDGDSLFAAANPTAIRPAIKPQVHPGTLEQSNVNMVSGMVRMITVSRAFEMAQRAIVTQDELLKHAANDLGRA